MTTEKCPVCRGELQSQGFDLRENGTSNKFHCEKCDCNYELRSENNKVTGWWKVVKLPVSLDSTAKYKLYMIEACTSGEVVEEYELSRFKDLKGRFECMSSKYHTGVDYVLVIAREDEFEDGEPTFDLDERTLCFQGDHGPAHHKIAAKNIKTWRDILEANMPSDTLIFVTSS